MIVTSSGLESLLRQTAKKSVAINQTGAVIHYGQVTGPPVQRSAVSGAGNAGAAAGTNIMKVPVQVGGNYKSQLCSFDDSYFPTVGDVVWLIQVGTSKKVRGHYMVGGRIAAGSQNAGNLLNTQNGVPRIVASSSAAGVPLTSTSGFTIASLTPYTQLGITSAVFRVNWSATISGTGELGIYIYTDDGTNQSGDFGQFVYAGGSPVSASGTETVTLSGTQYRIYGIPMVFQWSGTSSAAYVAVNASYSAANKCSVYSSIELLKAS